MNNFSLGTLNGSEYVLVINGGKVVIVCSIFEDTLNDLNVDDLSLNLISRLNKNIKGETLVEKVTTLSSYAGHWTYDERISEWVETANLAKGNKWYIADTAHFVIAEDIIEAQKAMETYLGYEGVRDYHLAADWVDANMPLVEME